MPVRLSSEVLGYNGFGNWQPRGLAFACSDAGSTCFWAAAAPVVLHIRAPRSFSERKRKLRDSIVKMGALE